MVLDGMIKDMRRDIGILKEGAANLGKIDEIINFSDTVTMNTDSFTNTGTTTGTFVHGTAKIGFCDLAT